MTQTPVWYPPHPQGPGQQHPLQGMNHQSDYHGTAPTGTGGMGHHNGAHASYHAHSMSANGGPSSMRPSSQMMHQHGQVPNARMNFHQGGMPQSTAGQPMTRFGAPHGSHMHHPMSAHNHAAYPPSNPQKSSFSMAQPPYSQGQQQLSYTMPMAQAPSSNRGIMPGDFASAMPKQRGPSQHHHYDDSPRSPSPPAIPPPPPKDVPESAPPKLFDTESKHNGRLSEDGPLRESRRQNSLSLGASDPNKLPPQDVPPKGAQSKGSQTKVPGKKISVHDASLLLGLRTNADSNSPETVPQDKEEVDSKVQNETDGTASETTFSDDTAKEAAAEKPKKSYPTRLALKADRANLNSLHCFIRSDLLEIFVIEPSKNSTNNSMAGRIGMQCVHCALNRPNDPKRVNEATMAVFYPRSISEIYRLVTNFTRCHLTKCRNMPPSVRSHWDSLRAVDKSRGKTQYWTDAAKLLGLVNITDTLAGGVRFRDGLIEPKHQEEDEVPTAVADV